jgi:K+-sensing histidine kinase KdpD
VVLLYLIPVVLAAGVGGLWAALPAALVADVVVNFFFVPPYNTLIVGNLEHVVVLLIYVLVALAISLAVDFAARQRAPAAKREVEALCRVASVLFRSARARFQVCSTTSRTRSG